MPVSLSDAKENWLPPRIESMKAYTRRVRGQCRDSISTLIALQLMYAYGAWPALQEPQAIVLLELHDTR